MARPPAQLVTDLREELLKFTNISVKYLKGKKVAQENNIPVVEFISSLESVSVCKRTSKGLQWECKCTFFFGQEMYCKINTYSEYDADSMEEWVSAVVSSDPSIFSS